MRIKTESRARVTWAIGLLSVAIVVASYNFGVTQRPAAPVQSAPEQKKSAMAGISRVMLDPALRDNIFEASRQLAYINSRRNIFAMKQDQQASRSDNKTGGAETRDEGRPSPPEEKPVAIDLKFFGYFRKSGEPKTVCVSQGETIFLAQEGSLVGLRYRIVEIRKTAVLVQDMLSNQQESIALMQ